MPVELTWETRGVVRQFTGFVTAEEFVASAHRIECHPDFDRFAYVIDDFTASHGNGIDAAALDEVAATCFGARETNQTLRVFIVAVDDDTCDKAQSAQELPAGVAFATTIVATRAAARTLLGLDPTL